jgi:hypothetical protein
LYAHAALINFSSKGSIEIKGEILIEVAFNAPLSNPRPSFITQANVQTQIEPFVVRIIAATSLRIEEPSDVYAQVSLLETKLKPPVYKVC